MAYSGQTQHYDLPIINPEDKANWYDMNVLAEKTDAQMYQNATDIALTTEKTDNNTAAIADADEQIGELKTNATNSSAQISALQNTVQQHTNHMNDIDDSIKNLEENVSTLSTDNSNVTQSISTLESQVNTLTTVQTAQGKNITENTSNIQTNTQAISEMRVDIEDNDKNTTELSDKVAANTNAIQKNSQDITQLQQKEIVDINSTANISDDDTGYEGYWTTDIGDYSFVRNGKDSFIKISSNGNNTLTYAKSFGSVSWQNESQTTTAGKLLFLARKPIKYVSAYITDTDGGKTNRFVGLSAIRHPNSTQWTIEIEIEGGVPDTGEIMFEVIYGIIYSMGN